MAAELLLGGSQAHQFLSTTTFNSNSKSKNWNSTNELNNSLQKPWLVGANSISRLSIIRISSRNSKRNNRAVFGVSSSLLQLTSDVFFIHQQIPSSSSSDLFLVADTATSTSGYSLASYYTSLGLFVISVPGLWSLIKRSVKSKVVFQIYILSLYTYIYIYIIYHGFHLIDVFLRKPLLENLLD